MISLHLREGDDEKESYSVGFQLCLFILTHDFKIHIYEGERDRQKEREKTLHCVGIVSGIQILISQNYFPLKGTRNPWRNGRF